MYMHGVKRLKETLYMFNINHVGCSVEVRLCDMFEIDFKLNLFFNNIDWSYSQIQSCESCFVFMHFSDQI